MAHDIDTTNGISSFASARIPAWHRLGTVFDREMTVTEALTVAHLGGWNVRKLPLHATEEIPERLDETGVWPAVRRIIELPDDRAVVRSNPITGETEAMGVVGAGFEPVQNEETAAFLSALLDESGAFIETAGALKGGRQVFVTAKLPSFLLVGGVDRVDLNIALVNGHDGSMAFRAIATPVRIVCANTLAAGLESAEQTWSRRHTLNVTSQVAEARQCLDLAYAYNAEFEVEAERMIQSTLADDKFEKVIEGIYSAPNDMTDSPLVCDRKAKRLDTLRGLYHDAPTQQAIRGTRWAGYQAIGEYEDHFVNVNGDDKDARRAVRTLDGVGRDRKLRAFKVLRVPAGAGA